MYTCILIRAGIFYKYKYSHSHKPSRTYQYTMHTNTLKDASEKRAYKFVKHVDTDAAYVHINMHAQRLLTVEPIAVPAPYQRAAGGLSVLNELDRSKLLTASILLITRFQRHKNKLYITYYKDHT